MKIYYWFLLLAFTGITVGQYSCTDPTELGVDLLKNDQANIGLVDTLTIKASTVVGDSIRTFDALAQLSSYLCGSFDDPIFGNTNASIYVQALVQSSSPDFTDFQLDSMVLVLPYDTLGIYGDTTQMYGIDVFRVIEDMNNEESHYSDETFETEDMPLASAEFIPRPRTSVEVIKYVSETDTDTVSFPHLRIPLPLSFGEELLSLDTSVYKDDDDFLAIMKGMRISASKNTAGMLSFYLMTAEAGITAYYTINDIPAQFIFQVGQSAGLKMVHFDHDYEGSFIEKYISEPSSGGSDSLLFVQSMAGVNTKIEIPYISSLGDIIINNAELEFAAMTISGDDETLFAPLEQIILSTKEEEGNLVIIDDIKYSGSSFPDGFGGKVQEREDGGSWFYTMNISYHLQDVVDGKENPILFLSAFPKPERASRVVLAGPDNPDYGIKLRITYTKL
ncbi:MAG: DUF4270 domain-containing protein [Bacteroidetes bacterium]|nr:DUF4270 domain-containing protein [Bacteroidota bacterium]